MVVRKEDPRHQEIWDRLALVTDPELDEPVTELGFVERLEVGPGNEVMIEFRLPTYWCAANFAFLMVDDIRLAVEAVPWVSKVVPRLQDHMYADAINEGVRHGYSFKKTFDELGADENLDELRRKFRVKAFQRRQEVLLRWLTDEGYSAARIVSMNCAMLQRLEIEDAEANRQRPRYFEILREFGRPTESADLAFVTPAGAPLTVSGFKAYLQDLRGIRINMEFNGAICRGLLSTRYKEANLVDGEPTLVDFMLDRVPPRTDHESETTERRER